MTATVQERDDRRVVIVGAGHGGATAAAMLRQRGFTGSVTLLGDEPEAPYHRPPLSKSVFTGGAAEQTLHPAGFYDREDIDLRIGTRVESVDRAAKRVVLADGETIAYDVLVLATGARPRSLPITGAELDGVLVLRDLADGRRLRDVAVPGARLAIIGGGWIGLEVAASARGAGIDATVLEREERLLARVASDQLSALLTARHLAGGVEILTEAAVTQLVGDGHGHVRAIRLADGREIACTHALVAVGAVADDELARAAGLPTENGLVVDGDGRTEDPGVYAIGDVTRRPIGGGAGLHRLESIPSAVDQARRMVAAVLGESAPTEEVPWFWSDQYDLKIQIAGILRDSDATVTRASGESEVAVFHLREGRVIALEAVNATRAFVASKQLIADATPVDAAALADPHVPLADVASIPHPTLVADVPEPVAHEPAGVAGPGGRAGEPLATFVLGDGTSRAVFAQAGRTLMDASLAENVPGIVAECGGMATCGTCHVVVDEHWREAVGDPEFEELDLLEFMEGRRPGSRLSCQIAMTDELDGLVVGIPGEAA